jgi:hypothetical protein
MMGAEQLARRRERLVLQSAAQRVQLEKELQLWRKPLHYFDVARAAGGKVREHASLIVIVLSGLLLLSRGSLLTKALVAARLARQASRWWSMAKVALRLGANFARRPSVSP